MTRLQWCRKHIDEVAEACNLSRQAKNEVKQAATFCDDHADFAVLPTRPIIALIRVRDEQVRERAIIKCRERLICKKGAGRGNTKTPTEKDIKKIIEDADIEVRNELTEKLRADKKEAVTNGPVIKEITDKEADHLSKIAPKTTPTSDGDGDEEGEQKKPGKPQEITGSIITTATITITRKEIDIHFDVMRKLSYENDIPKHKKKMDMMIENKMLIIVE